MRAYIEEAISLGRGSFEPPGAYGEVSPGDPRWQIAQEGYPIKVTRLVRR